MARKNIVSPRRQWDVEPIVDGMTTDVLGVSFLDGAAFTVKWNNLGTATGNILVDGAVWDERPLTTPDYAVLDMDAALISGNTGTALITLSWIQFSHLRLRFVLTSGSIPETATITCLSMAKQNGG